MKTKLEAALEIIEEMQTRLCNEGDYSFTPQIQAMHKMPEKKPRVNKKRIEEQIYGLISLMEEDRRNYCEREAYAERDDKRLKHANELAKKIGMKVTIDGPHIHFSVLEK